MKTKQVPNITKAKWDRYRRVQQGGLYNMVFESDKARKSAKLTFEDYWYIIEHYDELNSLFTEGKQ